MVNDGQELTAIRAGGKTRDYEFVIRKTSLFYNFVIIGSPPWTRQSGRPWERQNHDRSVPDPALDRSGAPVQIHDRLHQGEPEANTFRAAGRVGPIKTIENPGQMFGGNSGAGVFYRHFRSRVVLRYRNFDRAAGGSVVDGVFHQIIQSAAKEHLVGAKRGFAAAVDRELLLLRDRFVEG